MKILLLSDLHGHRPWYEWAIQQASDYELIALSGDLLDMFEPFKMQIEYVTEWAKNILDESSALAMCSGNHDIGGINPFKPVTADWMEFLHFPGKIISDGNSEILNLGNESIIITTVPYYCDKDFADDLWNDGQMLRNNENVKWLVLNHEPPSGKNRSYGSFELRKRIEANDPDFVLGGHMHEAPYQESFVERIGKTLCFNPGNPDVLETQIPAEPNHVILDLEKNDAVWNAWDMDIKRRLVQRFAF